MKKNYTDPILKFSVSFIALILLFIVLKELQHIFVPLVIAYFLFFVFEPMNHLLEKKKIPQGISIILDLIIISLIIWGMSRFIIGSFAKFGEELPKYEQKLNSIISGTALSLGITDEMLTNFNLQEILYGIDYGGIVSGLFSSTLSIFSTGFFILFFFIFVSSGHKRIIEAIKNRYVETHIKETVEELEKEAILNGEKINADLTTNSAKLQKIKAEKEKEIEKTFKDITEQVQRYIATKFLISLTTAVLVGITLWLFGVDFVIVWAVLTFFLNFIPNIGSVLAVILPAVMTLIQYESFTYMLIVAGVITVIQNIIGNILEPKIFGDRLGLNPLVILLSLLLWGYIWGIVGMFLSVPLTAVLKIIISNSGSENLRFIGELMSN